MLFVESTEGVGTTVTIVLPLFEETEEIEEELVSLPELAEELTALGETEENGIEVNEEEQTQEGE